MSRARKEAPPKPEAAKSDEIDLSGSCFARIRELIEGSTENTIPTLQQPPELIPGMSFLRLANVISSAGSSEEPPLLDTGIYRRRDVPATEACAKALIALCDADLVFRYVDAIYDHVLRPAMKDRRLHAQAAPSKELSRDLAMAVTWCGALRTAVKENWDAKDVLPVAFWAGTWLERLQVRFIEDNARIGRNKRQNARKAGRGRALSAEVTAERAEKVRQHFDELTAQKPNMKKSAIVQAISKRIGLNQREVWKYIPKSRPKKES